MCYTCLSMGVIFEPKPADSSFHPQLVMSASRRALRSGKSVLLLLLKDFIVHCEKLDHPLGAVYGRVTIRPHLTFLATSFQNTPAAENVSAVAYSVSVWLQGCRALISLFRSYLECWSLPAGLGGEGARGHVTH